MSYFTLKVKTIQYGHSPFKFFICFVLKLQYSQLKILSVLYLIILMSLLLVCWFSSGFSSGVMGGLSSLPTRSSMSIVSKLSSSLENNRHQRYNSMEAYNESTLKLKAETCIKYNSVCWSCLTLLCSFCFIKRPVILRLNILKQVF